MGTYRNGRTLQARSSNGSFRAWTGADFGVGFCPKCNHGTTRPPEPEALKSRQIAPEEFRRWQNTLVCTKCGWTNQNRPE